MKKDQPKRPASTPRRPALAGHALRGLALRGALLATLVAAAWTTGPLEARKNKPRQVTNANDLVIVDCLLPHKTRRLGRKATFLVPRKPIRTTAVDCRIRGGEHTEPDQVTLATALAVWQPQAEAGDAEAQFYVGQIYEKGLGTAANPTRAADWYRKAAEQGFRSAQVSLGFLYETGSGIAADEAEALRWYRRAAGTAEDLVVLAQGDYSALLEAQVSLEEKNEEVAQMSGEIAALQQQLAALENASEADRQRRGALAALLARLRKDIASREQDVATQKDHIRALQTATADAAAARTAAAGGAAAGSADPADVSKLAFGAYHALVIGNRNYRALPETPTAATDAQGVATLLEERYGFDVTLLIDATRFDIMRELNRLRTDLDENDHLLVYYAGHGVRDAEGETAYWQPIDADPESPANWIPSAVVTEHLDIIPARHVFVVADSVYSGLRTRSSIARLPQGMTEEQRYFHIKGLLDRRARLVLAAGSEEPVVDGNSAERSRFTRTLLDVLSSNDGILEASALYYELNRRLADDPARPRLRVDFATLKWARNDLGDFFFVPNRS